ncbi:MAG: UDP-N-acetylglucosamine 2-epimerase [Cytophagales bacterium]|nr:UDP-N-acetylglucosamine 2-epimerase [Cytophagales bacterium]
MTKRKVCVVITARPSYSRIKSALTEITRNPNLELQLVVAASANLDRYGSAVNYMEKDGFEVRSKVFNVLEGENLMAAAKTTGLGILELSTVFDNIKPEVVVTIADRFETMATAIAATYMNIPLVHIQGGEVTGSIDEKVRHAITKLADYHFVSTKGAMERVIKMGEDQSAVFNTGCPSIDLAASVLSSPHLDFNPYSKYGGVGIEKDLSGGYLVVMQHPVTTEYAESRLQITETLNALNKLPYPVLLFWPNVDAGSDGTSKGIREFRELDDTRKFHFFKNFEPDDFLKLILNAKCLVGNSSVGIRECSFLGVPTVNIGSRQEGRERGANVLDVGYGMNDIYEGAIKQISNGKCKSETIYGDGKAGKRISDLLETITPRISKRITY